MGEVECDENEGHVFTLGSTPSTVHLSFWQQGDAAADVNDVNDV